MQKVKFELEYPLNASAKILYSRLSTPSGLAEWFANDVKLKENQVFEFIWNKTGEEARLIYEKENSCIRFKWLDDDDPDVFFEFNLITRELTGDLSLIITDFALPEEIEEAKELWDQQISDLKHSIGI